MTKFYGMLTVNNIEQVSNMILEMLSGKTYTFTSVYKYKRFQPETRTNQHLENGTNGSPLSIYHGTGNEYAGFSFCDTYGVWGCSTNIEKDVYDSEFNNPYIVIDWNQITISQKTPAGKKSYWKITLQD